jgi:hypothetical protein
MVGSFPEDQIDILEKSKTVAICRTRSLENGCMHACRPEGPDERSAMRDIAARLTVLETV